MKFDYIFVDLDDTLFQTYLFKKDIFQVFYSYGVSRQDCAAAYKQAVFGPMEGYFCYTFKKHADILRAMNYELPNEVENKLDNLLKNNYADPEAFNFLSGLKELGGKMILQTAGECKLQQIKIENCRLSQYFDRMDIIDGGKAEHIKNITRQARKILFINDNLKENIKIQAELSNVLVVAKKHAVPWEGDDYTNYNLPYFNSLMEILNYVREFK